VSIKLRRTDTRLDPGSGDGAPSKYCRSRLRTATFLDTRLDRGSGDGAPSNKSCGLSMRIAKTSVESAARVPVWRAKVLSSTHLTKNITGLIEMTMFCRWGLAALVMFFTLEHCAEGQIIFPGSTPEGDYLRGVGLAAWGMGIYNLDTAKADATNLDTGIRFNEYLAAVAEESTRAYVARKRAAADEEKEFYRRNRERVRNSPEWREVANGEALNRLLEELQNPKLTDSVFRSERMQIPLPVSIVRHIPFALAEKGQQFSMDRLSLKGKGKWTVAFQDTQFDIVKRAYAAALDKALEEAIDGRMQTATIEVLETKADDILNRLNEVLGPINDTRYKEGTKRVKELKNIAEQLKTTKIEQAISDLDKYSGTTVYDLKVFMANHNLRFGKAEGSEETEIFEALYELMAAQYDKVKISDPPEGK
jgi:hypothetical protein